MSTDADPAPGADTPVPTCYRHPGRESHLRCTRCDRYICPDCMRDAAVGHQCVECVAEGNKSVRPARTVFGGRPSVAPVVTYTLIGINIVAYVAELIWPTVIDRFGGLGIGLMRGDGQTFGWNGFEHPGFQTVGIAEGEWYRLITSAFLHQPPIGNLFGIFHIIFNMVWLWVFGSMLESALGRWRFVVLYLLSAVGGSVLAFLISPTESGIGASGAIFGLAAAYFFASRKIHGRQSDAGRTLVFFLIWLVISASISSWEAHLGGLLVGGAIGLAFTYTPQRQRKVVHILAPVAMLAVLLALVVVKTGQMKIGTV